METSNVNLDLKPLGRYAVGQGHLDQLEQHSVLLNSPIFNYVLQFVQMLHNIEYIVVPRYSLTKTKERDGCRST